MRSPLKDININFFRNNNLEFVLFSIGVLFLASAPFISCILFLYPISHSIINNKFNLLEDKYNQTLLLVSILMIARSLFSSFESSNQLEAWDSSMSWAYLANWLPLFVCFVGFQTYLKTNEQRKIISKFFLAGTIPVLISCFGQYWFDWYGPFETLNGLIKWFQRPLTIDNQNVTGLFSNPNYAGAWLTMIWPFSIALFKEKFETKNFLKSNIIFLIILMLSTSIVLTNSRNAWLGFLIPIPLILGKKSLKWFLPMIILTLFLIFTSFLPYVPNELKIFSQNIIPSNIVGEFSEITLDFQNIPRLFIWKEAIGFIIEKPFFGWGASTFPFLYKFKSGLWNDHTHNLFLELSISYGFIVSTIIYALFLFTLFRSVKIIYFKDKGFSSIDKGWVTAEIIFLISHLNDVLIFDIRINLASWIFIAGLRNISKQYSLQKNEHHKK